MPAPPDALATIRAAGGVVWRPTAAGSEVCLVHRPRYDDWSLPKGKVEAGEHPLAAAVREVAEEAGVRAVPQVHLPQVRYTTRNGTPKVVDFWSMRAVATGGFEVHTEVDDVRWLPVESAVELVTYPQDVRVLRRFAALRPVTAVLAVVRHGSAGDRITWPAPDPARPLDDDGVAQAGALAPLLALIRPQRLLSATARRCAQTLDPLAVLRDLPVEVDPTFDEPEPRDVAEAEAQPRDVAERVVAAAARLSGLAAAGTPAVVCSQGRLVPDALARLAGDSPQRFETAKGGGWLLAFSGGDLVAVDPLTAAVR